MVELLMIKAADGSWRPAEEVWADVPGYPAYQVSTHGYLRKKNPEKKRFGSNYVLKRQLNGNGYPVAQLWENNKRKIWPMHRLVATVFLSVPSNAQCCAHNDGNPLNCHVSNLRWTTHKDNHADKHKHGTINRGNRNGAAVLTEENVPIIVERLVAGETQARIALDFGVCSATIGVLARGQSWSWLTGLRHG